MPKPRQRAPSRGAAYFRACCSVGWIEEKMGIYQFGGVDPGMLDARQGWRKFTARMEATGMRVVSPFRTSLRAASVMIRYC